MIYKDFIEFKQHFKQDQRLIAIDYGQKKTGIAVSDRMLTISTPYGVINTSSYNQLERDLEKIIAENSPWGIIIGYPIEVDGAIGKACHRIYSLSNRFFSKFKLPIMLLDERGTTKDAQSFLKNLEIKRKRRDNIDDKIAASILLQKILDQFC